MKKTKTTALLVLALGAAGGYWLMTKYILAQTPKQPVDPATGLPAPPTSVLNIPQLSGYYVTTTRRR
jgi:hypothetical protein